MLGSIVDGRYLLVSLLGQGGMGRVYEAHDAVSDQRVALKLISAQGPDMSMLAARLQREARAASLIHSPHVAKLLSTGTDSSTSAPYAVFEYLAGMNLQDWLDRLGVLPPELALRIAVQASIGLESVHAAGFVHRDIKPSNLFLQEVGEERIVKLLDFGLVRLQLDAPELEGWKTLTRSGGLLGSPLYLSPEQARSAPEVDHRSDIWSLGVVLYKALTGLTPHESIKGLGELIIAICQRPAPPVSERAPWVSAELSSILAKALALEPRDRFQHISELRGALCALLPGGTAIHAGMLVASEHAGAQNKPSGVSAHGESQKLAEAHERTATISPTLIASPKVEVRPAQLPSPVNRLIGRDRETLELKQLVSNCRLVTLLGPGGTGKTRLAIHVATQLADTFAQGAGFVDLSPITDAASIPRAFAAALGIREEPGQPLQETLALQLRAKHLLIVLDNCEHLVAPCAEYVEPLLAACPRLWIIATSREPLAIVAETTFLMAPLPIPEQSAELSLENVAKADAVRLFVERAQSVNPSFVLSQTNAGPVAHVCRQLDGIPLALELAAARMRAMTVEQLAAQIDDRFRILSGVRRGASRRQQTLRALIDWSHDLLAEPERAVLRRLSVFQGGFSVAAAEGVCGWEGDPLGIDQAQVFDLLYQLVSKSLLIVSEQGGSTRYRMLETIRHYARDKLQASGEEARARARHLDYFLRLAQEAEPALRSGAQLSWLARLEVEHDNLRAALDTCEASPEQCETGLRLAGTLGRFWWLRGHHSEGCTRLERLLASASGGAAAIRAKALCQFALLLPSIQQAHPAWEEGLAAYRSVGDERGVSFALLGAIQWEAQRGNREASLPLIQEGIALARKVGDAWLMARHHDELGRYHLYRSEYPEAARVSEEGLALARATGDRSLMGLLLLSLAFIASFQGDYARARTLLEECLGMQQVLGFKRGTAETLTTLGGALQLLREYDRAARCFEQALGLAQSIGDEDLTAKALLNLGELALIDGNSAQARPVLRSFFERAPVLTRRELIAWGLLMTARLGRTEGPPEQAVRFFAAEQTLEDTFGIVLHPHWRRGYAEPLEELRSTMGDAGQHAWDEGRRMQLADAIQAALAYLAPQASGG